MTTKKQGAALFPLLFGLISLLFIGIMIYVYRGSRQADPVMLDEQGRPKQAQHS
ncbi:MAG: hypothetical protein IPQ13_00335 [Holophagaceae bacterium]|nr:hypothetical protein [Holophagaceae bacterium]